LRVEIIAEFIVVFTIFAIIRTGTDTGRNYNGLADAKIQRDFFGGENGLVYLDGILDELQIFQERLLVSIFAQSADGTADCVASTAFVGDLVRNLRINNTHYAAAAIHLQGTILVLQEQRSRGNINFNDLHLILGYRVQQTTKDRIGQGIGHHGEQSTHGYRFRGSGHTRVGIVIGILTNDIHLRGQCIDIFTVHIILVVIVVITSGFSIVDNRENFQFLGTKWDGGL